METTSLQSYAFIFKIFVADTFTLFLYQGVNAVVHMLVTCRLVNNNYLLKHH